MKNIELSNYENGDNPHLQESFVSEKSPLDTMKENFEKGLIDQDTYDKGVAAYDKIVKAVGSRGGKVIGYTKNGKAIYENRTADHDHYKNFSKEEHKEAADHHFKNYKKEGADGSTVLHGKRSFESHLKASEK